MLASNEYLCPECGDEIFPREVDGFYECKCCGVYGSVYEPDFGKDDEHE
jgi:ribosomal protein L37AE/L43A